MSNTISPVRTGVKVETTGISQSNTVFKAHTPDTFSKNSTQVSVPTGSNVAFGGIFSPYWLKSTEDQIEMALEKKDYDRLIKIALNKDGEDVAIKAIRMLGLFADPETADKLLTLIRLTDFDDTRVKDRVIPQYSRQGNLDEFENAIACIYRRYNIDAGSKLAGMLNCASPRVQMSAIRIMGETQNHKDITLLSNKLDSTLDLYFDIDRNRDKYDDINLSYFNANKMLFAALKAVGQAGNHNDTDILQVTLPEELAYVKAAGFAYTAMMIKNPDQNSARIQAIEVLNSEDSRPHEKFGAVNLLERIGQPEDLAELNKIILSMSANPKKQMMNNFLLPYAEEAIKSINKRIQQ